MPDIGSIILLDVLVDGASAHATLGAVTNIEALDGTDSSMDLTSGFSVGASTEGLRRVWIGRAMATGETSAVVTAPGAGDDCFARMYEFSSVAAGTTLATVLDGSGALNNDAGTGTTIGDATYTTSSTNRLVVGLVAVMDDVLLSNFAGAFGGTWTLVTQFTGSAGTQGALGLYTAPMAAAGTIDGGYFSISPSAPWSGISIALLPLAGVMPYFIQAGAGASITGATGTASIAATGSGGGGQTAQRLMLLGVG